MRKDMPWSSTYFGERMVNRTMRALMLVCLSSLCAACVRTAALKPEENKGVIYLSMSGGHWRPPGEVSYSRGIRSPSRARSVGKKMEGPQKFSQIKLKDDNGRIVGKRVVPVFYGEILMQTLEQQLHDSGYTVKVVPLIPAGGNGIDISWIAADLDQRGGLFTLDGKCTLQATMAVWRKGSKMKEQRYRSEAADYAIADQDQLHLRLMEEASRKMVADGMAGGLAAVP